jgi:uncharacterized protein (DUF305 family)
MTAPARPGKRTAGESGAPRPAVCRCWRRPGPASVLVAVAVFAACRATAALAQTNGPSSTGLASIAMSPAAAASFIAESNAIFAALAVPLATPSAELPFIRENHAAMTKMVACMAVKPTGTIDDDFVAMMVPHHQGAIDMAQAELRYGRNEQLLRIGQEIIVVQLQENAAMRVAVGEKVSRDEAMLAASGPGTATMRPSSSPSNVGRAGSLLDAEVPFLEENNVAMTKMMRDMTIKPTGEIDRDFVAMMVPHHQGAIDMAQAELRYGHNPELRRIAQEIIVDQTQEITLMRLAVGEPLPPSASSPTDPPPASAFQASPWMPVCGECP